MSVCVYISIYICTYNYISAYSCAFGLALNWSSLDSSWATCFSELCAYVALCQSWVDTMQLQHDCINHDCRLEVHYVAT